MPLPLIPLATGIAGKLVVKAYFATKMVALKSFLTSYIGATVANVSVGLLATAAAAAWWEKSVKGNSDQAAIDAAMAKGVTKEVARGVVKWLTS